MSHAHQRPQDYHPETSVNTPASNRASLAILVIEKDSITPLGPKIVFANEIAANYTGYEINSLIGSPLGLIYDHADLSNLIEKLPYVASRPTFCWMDRVLLKNGGFREKAHWTIRPTQKKDASRDYEISHFTLTFEPSADRGVTLDTPTEIPLQTEPLEIEPLATVPSPTFANEQLEKARSESLALTAGGVAHDFKNALQAIKSNLELANLVASGNEELVSFLKDAHHALHDAETLARQMLAFTREGSSEKKIFQVKDLLERVTHLCTSGSQVRAQLTFNGDVRTVEGDPDQIYQVLHNLVINARQAMPNGGVVHLTAGNANLRENNDFEVSSGHYTVISVRDRGSGIPREVLPFIFESHFTTKKEGTGFGLASCKAIIESHGGAIRAASSLGVGTEFLIFLPSSDEKETTSLKIPDTPATRHIVPRPSGGQQILVVDDQKDVSKAACAILRHLGYESLCAFDGAEAILQYRELLETHEPIDLVLLDMTLPGGLLGREVCRELHRIDPDVKVIATSGYFDENSASTLLGDGFIGVLPKPFSIDQLSAAIEEALAK